MRPSILLLAAGLVGGEALALYMTGLASYAWLPVAGLTLAGVGFFGYLALRLVERWDDDEEAIRTAAVTCHECGKPLYVSEAIWVNGQEYHRACALRVARRQARERAK